MPPATEVAIVSGSLIIYRIFDVAEEFDLKRIENALSDAGSSRLKLARSRGQALVLRDAPITIALGSSTVRLGTSEMPAEVFARIWSYGVVSLQFHVAINAGTAWKTLVALASCVEDDNDIDAIANRRVRDLASSLRTAAQLPHEPQGMEDYAVYFVEKLDGIDEPRQLLDRVDVPALILGEAHTDLSDDVRKPILQSALSYSTRDLAVIDWNSALVVDPDGSRDVPDMLEFAATHLMEFRYFDNLLDDRLEALYSQIERHHRLRSFFRNDSERLSHEASSLYIEFSEHVERVENSLKFVGDFFLATVFRQATARFQLNQWQESVMRKVNTLAQTAEVLSDETNVRRSHVLELIIIILILYEIVHAAVAASG